MVLLILLIILFGFIGWLLLSPIQLILDSNRQLYCVRWMGLGRIGMKVVPGDVVVRYDSWLFHHDFYPLKRDQKKKAEKKKKPKKKSRYSFGKVSRKARKILRSFEIKSFLVNLDTDDYILNGYLFPLCHALGKGKHLRINFQGEMEIHVVVENRLVRILKAIIF